MSGGYFSPFFLPFYPAECFPTLNTSRFYHSKQDAEQRTKVSPTQWSNDEDQFFKSRINSLEQSLNCLVGWIHCLGVSLFYIQLKIGSRAKRVAWFNQKLWFGLQLFCPRPECFLCVSPRIKPAASENGFLNLPKEQLIQFSFKTRFGKNLHKDLQTNFKSLLLKPLAVNL